MSTLSPAAVAEAPKSYAPGIGLAAEEATMTTLDHQLAYGRAWADIALDKLSNFRPSNLWDRLTSKLEDISSPKNKIAALGAAGVAAFGVSEISFAGDSQTPEAKARAAQADFYTPSILSKEANNRIRAIYKKCRAGTLSVNPSAGYPRASRKGLGKASTSEVEVDGLKHKVVDVEFSTKVQFCGAVATNTNKSAYFFNKLKVTKTKDKKRYKARWIDPNPVGSAEGFMQQYGVSFKKRNPANK